MPTIKLTDTQLVILATAAKVGRPIGCDDISNIKAKRAALARSVEGLLKRGMLKEVRVKAGMAFWRKDDGGRPKGLVITAKGIPSQGIEAPAKTADRTAAAGHSVTPSIRAGTKKGRLVDLLQTEDGISIAVLSETLAWKPHTTRAAITRLRQSGFEVERSQENGESRYRIVSRPEAA